MSEWEAEYQVWENAKVISEKDLEAFSIFIANSVRSICLAMIMRGKGINVKIFRVKKLFMEKLRPEQLTYMCQRIGTLSIFNTKFKTHS